MATLNRNSTLQVILNRFRKMVTIPDFVQDGLVLGVDTQTDEIVVSNANLPMVVAGQGGSGKSHLTSRITAQKMRQGESVLTISHDPSLLARFIHDAQSADRLHDVVVIDPTRPEQSANFNPFLDADPDEVTCALLGIALDAGTDREKQYVHFVIFTVVNALQIAGMDCNCQNLANVLGSSTAMRQLYDRVVVVDSTCRSARSLNFIIRILWEDTPLASKELEGCKQLFRIISGHLKSIDDSTYGPLLRPTPSLALAAAINEGKLIFISTPMYLDGVVAQHIATFLIKCALPGIIRQRLVKSCNDRRVHIHIDNSSMGALGNGGLQGMLEQAREARMNFLIELGCFPNPESKLWIDLTHCAMTYIFLKQGSRGQANLAVQLFLDGQTTHIRAAWADRLLSLDLGHAVLKQLSEPIRQIRFKPHPYTKCDEQTLRAHINSPTMTMSDSSVTLNV